MSKKKRRFDIFSHAISAKKTAEEVTMPVAAPVKMYYDDTVKQSLVRAVEMNFPALLVGDTGTGKTSIIRELAKQHSKELIRINLTGNTGVDEIVGKYLASEKGTYWVNGLLIEAMNRGWWVVFDEINMALPEVLSKLHSLLDDDRKIMLVEKEGEAIVPHDDFRFFATMNPPDEYAGTKEMNKALTSRFPIILNVDYSPNEIDILTERTGVDEKTATDLVMVAREVRKHKEDSKITYTCSTRDLISCADLMVAGLDKEAAVEVSIINKANGDERKALKTLFSLITDGRISIPDTSDSYESITELQEKAKEFSKEKKKLQDRVSDLEREVKNKEGEVEKAKMTVNDKEAELIKHQTEIKGLKVRINGFVSAIQGMKGEIVPEEVVEG